MTGDDVGGGGIPAVSAATILGFGQLEIDVDARVATLAGVPLHLTGIEFDLLAFFAARPHQLFSRMELLEAVWHSHPDWQQESTVTEHIYRLRSKLKRRGEASAIVTVRGGGYRFEPLDAQRGAATAAGLDPDDAQSVWVPMLRALLRIRSAEEASALVQLAVRQMGGGVVRAQDAGDDAIPLDLALGEGPPMLVVVEPFSVARMRLERLLPGLVEDARNAVALLGRSRRLG